MKSPKLPDTSTLKKPTLPEGAKRALKVLLMPPGFVVALGALATAALMYWVFGMGNENTPLSYAAYVVSAYAVVILCVYVVLRDPLQRVNALLRKSRHLGRIVDDREYRASIGVRVSLLIDLLWAGANFVMGVMNSALWFVVLGSYYLVLFIMRLLLVRYGRKDKASENRRGELRAQLICGIMLAASILTLSGVILLVVRNEGGFAYSGLLIYAIALYVFCTLGFGIANFLKFRKHENPILTATMGINLAVALVSIFSLEAAMLTMFGTPEDETFRFVVTILTGTGVSIAVAAIGTYMAMRANTGLRTRRGCKR